MAKVNRGKLDDTLAAMFSNPDYRDSYLFYAHMIGQCSVKIRRDIPSCAGVAFQHDHFNLYINPDSVWTSMDGIDPSKLGEIEPDDIKEENGVTLVRVIRGFDDYTLVERLAILKHEMLHILFDHVNPQTRALNLAPLPWNYATDCALNQSIDKNHLPKTCVLPDGLSKMLNGIKVPDNQSSEFYYNLIKDEVQKNQNGEGDGEGDGEGEGQSDKDGKGGDKKGKNSGKGKPKLMDDHGTWNESEGDPELQQDVTKKMIEKSQNETIKSRGTVPSECGEWLQMFTRKCETNWKKEFRNVVGNKKIGTRTTIMKRDRRFPHRDDLKGKTKERKFDVLVIADVSGSQSNEGLMEVLNEVRYICDVTKTGVDVIQIDTRPSKPEKLTKKTKVITRKGCGGTEMWPAIEVARQHNLKFNAVVVATDGGLAHSDVEAFKTLGMKVFWLISSDGVVMDNMNEGRMKAFKLKGK